MRAQWRLYLSNIECSPVLPSCYGNAPYYVRSGWGKRQYPTLPYPTLPVERGEVEVQLEVDLVHELSDGWILHDGEQKAPLHRWTIGKPNPTNNAQVGLHMHRAP